MELSLRRWRPGRLLASWCAYWVGLGAVTLTPAIRATLRATQGPEGHGTVTAGYENAAVTYSVMESGVKTFAASVPFSTIVLWVVGPPLALWLVWLMVRRRPTAEDHALGGADRAALGIGDEPAVEWQPDLRERIRTPEA